MLIHNHSQESLMSSPLLFRLVIGFAGADQAPSNFLNTITHTALPRQQQIGTKKQQNKEKIKNKCWKVRERVILASVEYAEQ